MMISKGIKAFCCGDFCSIENYEQAVNDTTQVWECHHRLETHTSDGERRLVDISAVELKALKMYYSRPPEELIFLTHCEHCQLHNKGKHFSEEHKKRISDAGKGRVLGPLSEKTKKKISQYAKGKHWKLVNGKSVWY